MSVFISSFDKKGMTAPTEQVKLLPDSSAQFSGSVLKEMDNKIWKGKRVSRRWSSSLKWSGKKKKIINSEKTSFPTYRKKKILTVSDNDSCCNRKLLKCETLAIEEHGRSSSKTDSLEMLTNIKTSSSGLKTWKKIDQYFIVDFQDLQE